MKRMMMQLLRSIVTVLVCGMMAVMIFSLRGELANAKAELRKKMSAMEAIMTRTSVRQYTDEVVTPEQIAQLERAAMAAPTACNAQPWEIIAITDPEVLAKIPAAHPHAAMAAKAPLAFVICGTDNGLEGLGKEYWVQDCSAATENLLLAAHAMGLGAVWCGVYPIPERVSAIKELLSIPEGVTPLNVVVVGHPTGPTRPKDKWKVEKLHQNRW